MAGWSRRERIGPCLRMPHGVYARFHRLQNEKGLGIVDDTKVSVIKPKRARAHKTAARSKHMSEMGLVVVGAAGRMGQTLIRTVHSIDGARVVGAIERPGSPHLGKDAGELAGTGPLNVTVSDDPLPVFAKADGVLDFSAPAATVEFAGYAAQARIVHVIGTTGCTAEDDAKIAAAARQRNRRKIRQYEPWSQPADRAGGAGRPRARRFGFRHRDP